MQQLKQQGGPPTNNLTDAALKSVSSLMGLQLFSRLVTFVLNQALVRLTTPDVYGTVSIQLELLLNTILFLSREGFRNALLRADVDKEQKGSSLLVSNIALLPVYFGVLVSSLTSAAYFYYASEATKVQPFFNMTVLLYTFAAILELLSEPMHIRALQSLKSAVRVKAEGGAVIIKSIVTVALLVYDSSRGSGNLSLMAFALGQLSYSIVLLIVYVPEFRQSVSFILRPSRSDKPTSDSVTGMFTLTRLTSKLRSYFDENLLEVSLAMTGQGFMKHILTEGDKIIISRVSPLKDQGGYAVANNYGALIARIFFQPIEETSRLFFSKTLSSTSSGSLDSVALQNALTRLASLLLIYSHFSLFLLSLAPPYLKLVLSVVLPPRYLNTSAPAVLSAWVWYIPVLAVNGVLEAFVSSVASPKELAIQSRWMAGASVAYIALTVMLYSLAGLGDTAVVYANIANLVARILYCTQFISSLIKRGSKGGDAVNTISRKDLLPPASVGFAFAAAGIVTRLSYRLLNVENIARSAGRNVLKSPPCILHLGIGTSCGVVLLAACFLGERERVKQLMSLISSRTRKKTQ